MVTASILPKSHDEKLLTSTVLVFSMLKAVVPPGELVSSALPFKLASQRLFLEIKVSVRKDEGNISPLGHMGRLFLIVESVGGGFLFGITHWSLT